MSPLENIIKLGQKCIESMPVLVIGSGSSAAHGVRGMIALQNHLLETVRPTTVTMSSEWDRLRTSLSDTKDLEKTLQNVQIGDALLSVVVNQTREMVLSDDLQVLEKVVHGELELPLTRLFRHMLRSTHPALSVITTNYDRLAEYAAEAGKFRWHVGFSDGHFRYFADASSMTTSRRLTRCIEVWKVHGSVDWFLNDHNAPVALPSHGPISRTFKPLLVTPGVFKYQATHQEPFRSIITRADAALASAPGFLCVGYGFNDTHVEPKLIDRVLAHEVPIVILARTLRDPAKRFLSRCKHEHFLAIERNGNGSRAYYKGAMSGEDLDGASLWSLSEFLDATIGTN